MKRPALLSRGRPRTERTGWAARRSTICTSSTWTGFGSSSAQRTSPTWSGRKISPRQRRSWPPSRSSDRRERTEASGTMAAMSFATTEDAFFAGFFSRYPTHATDAGNHDHDSEWPDLTSAGREERLAWLAEIRASIEAAEGLSRDEEIDRRVLLGTIDEARFEEEDLD